LNTTAPSLFGRDITAVILAGGTARRMGGEDKGLIELHGRPLLGYVLDALRPQVANILVNANRYPERYRALGCPVAGDIVGGFHGPLAGIATGMQTARTPLLLVVPCDSPFLPGRLVEVLYRRMEKATADICAAHDGSRLQQLYALLRCDLLTDLLCYLEGGGRRVDDWYRRHRLAVADFSATPQAFLNLNTPQDREDIERKLAAGRDRA
jgi:molybdopterin-guanine dinucleotide biosynthesis protein A